MLYNKNKLTKIILRPGKRLIVDMIQTIRAVLPSNDGDFDKVNDIIFEDIRIDDFQEGQLLNLRGVNNAKYNTGPGKGIENIFFKDISYNGLNLIPSLVSGLDRGHSIKDISFQNFRINGKLILNLAAANIKIGNDVSNVNFRNKSLMERKRCFIFSAPLSLLF